MKKLVLILFIIGSSSLFAQQDSLFDIVRLNGSITNFVDNQKLDKYQIRIILDTEIIFIQEYAGNESYSIDLPYGFEYTVIYYSKNHVSRRALIDATDIPLANQKIYDLKCDLGLVPKQKGLKTKDISKMFSGIARYSPTKDNVEWFPKQKERIDKLFSERILASKG